ncbi:MAG: CbiQ family ECF transporter T component [Acidimicrobiia bacterium]
MHRPAATPRPWHSLAWLAWAIAAAVVVQLAPSPVYVALVIGVCWIIVEAHAPDGPYRRTFPSLLLLGVVYSVFRVVLAALTTHNGIDVLVTLPHATMPDVLGGFTIGGTVESGIVLQALGAGFTVVGMMAVFGAANTVWSHYELVQATPRAFHELGVIVTVGLAFVPATVESFRAVREADLARTGGRRIRRDRVLRSTLPVLERGMERAVALSESMDARGFGIRGPVRAEVEAGWCAVVALLALAVAFVALIGEATTVALVCAILGTLALGVGVWRASAGTRRRHYRRRELTRADWLLVGAVGLAPIAIALIAAVGNSTLSWYASPVDWPRFDPVVALAILLLLAPLARRPRPESPAAPARHSRPATEIATAA